MGKLKSRGQARRALIRRFLTEESGQGQAELASRYEYFVETLSDDRRIFLRRPASLNKGFDFEIWVQKWKKGTDGRPSHRLILRDLRRKMRQNPRKYTALNRGIDKVYRLHEPDIILGKLDLRFKSGYSAELLLKVLKWMFIEQDITYWNWSGRAMLKNGIDNIPK